MTALLLATLLAWTPPCQGDGHNQHRSPGAKAAFRRAHPCPATQRRTGKCPGFVIDHICPLACCGLDAAQNMQWQTRAESKAKDHWETKQKGCRTLCAPALPDR